MTKRKWLGTEKQWKVINDMALASKGKKRPPFTKEHIENIRKSHIGEKHTKERTDKRVAHFIGKKHSEQWKKNISIGLLKRFGGRTPVAQMIRTSSRYSEWRKTVFIRDGFQCRDCYVTGRDLRVHHIKRFSVLMEEAILYFPLLNHYDACMLYTPLWEEYNGITLCDKCHKKRHNILKGKQ